LFNIVLAKARGIFGDLLPETHIRIPVRLNNNLKTAYLLHIMIKRALKHTYTLLNVDHVSLGPKWNYKNVISPYFRLYYIDAGAGEISDISTTLELEPGFLYIIPSFTLCNLTCQSHLSQYFIQFFKESSDGNVQQKGLWKHHLQ
jgi:hypothetical protein